MTIQPFLELLKRCVENHTFDFGDPDCQTVLDQLYRAYAESHEDDPPGIREGFKELENFLEVLPLNDNNAIFNLCCRICVSQLEKVGAYGHDGVEITLFGNIHFIYHRKPPFGGKRKSLTPPSV